MLASGVSSRSFARVRSLGMSCVLGSVLFWPRAPRPPVATHPLHTALTELSYQADSGGVFIRVRLFTDDLAVALPGLTGSGNSLLSRYARGALALTDPAGRPLPLIWQGVERTGDTMLLQLRARLGGGLERAHILVALLWERFPDQVNIVRAAYSGRPATLLFTRGERREAPPMSPGDCRALLREPYPSCGHSELLGRLIPAAP